MQRRLTRDKDEGKERRKVKQRFERDRTEENESGVGEEEQEERRETVFVSQVSRGSRSRGPTAGLT